MRSVRGSVCTLSLLLVASSSCLSSNYAPRSTGRVSMLLDGAPTLVRDGKRHSAGWFGGGLVAAVADDPDAKRAAETYYHRNLGGGLTELAGVLCFGGLLIADGVTDVGTKPANAVAAGCTLLVMVGLWWSVCGVPYLYDAINIFNDDKQAQEVVPKMPGEPGWDGSSPR